MLHVVEMIWCFAVVRLAHHSPLNCPAALAPVVLPTGGQEHGWFAHTPSWIRRRLGQQRLSPPHRQKKLLFLISLSILTVELLINRIKAGLH